jgi:hypothetical protein
MPRQVPLSLARYSATGLIEKAGYRGFTEVEIFSANDWWKRPGDDVIRTCIERFGRIG